MTKEELLELVNKKVDTSKFKSLSKRSIDEELVDALEEIGDDESANDKVVTKLANRLKRMDGNLHANVSAEVKKAKEEADKVNAAESTAFQIEKSMEELGDKVTEEEKSEIKPLIEDLRNAANERNIEKIDTAQKALQEKWFPIMTKIYQAQQQESQAGTENQEEPVKEEPKE